MVASQAHHPESPDTRQLRDKQSGLPGPLTHTGRRERKDGQQPRE